MELDRVFRRHRGAASLMLVGALLSACGEPESGPDLAGKTAALSERPLVASSSDPAVAAWNKCCQDANGNGTFDSCGSPTYNTVTKQYFCQTGWVQANCKEGATPGQCTKATAHELPVEAFAYADDDEATVLQEIWTRQGERVRFLEGEPGDLAVDLLTPGSADLSAFKALQQGNIDELEFFRQVTGGGVPSAALVAAARRAASQRALDSRAAPELDDEEGENTAQGQSEDAAGDTADSALPYWLQLCNGWDFAYCWMNQTSTPWCKHKCYFMEGRVKPLEGTIPVRLRYKKNGSWKTFKSVTVPKGFEYYVNHYNWAIKRWRRFEVVSNNAHYLHHWACYGID